jgi:hypothetical protein
VCMLYFSNYYFKILAVKPTEAPTEPPTPSPPPTIPPARDGKYSWIGNKYS